MDAKSKVPVKYAPMLYESLNEKLSIKSLGTISALTLKEGTDF